ncbi:MAG: glycosyltransferase [Bacteroidales bacterium]|nr:glycosyltransferase [Bacteroidales bacterium]
MKNTILHIHQKNATDNVFQVMLSRWRAQGISHLVLTESDVDYSDIRLTHAHSWFNDGKVALQLFESQQIPYVLTITEGDMELAHGFSAWRTGKKILEHARQIIFTNPMSERILADELPDKLADQVFSHAVTIYHSIETHWLNDLYLSPPVSKVNVKLLYAGEPDKSGNLSSVIKATDAILHRNLGVTLTVVQMSDTNPDAWHKLSNDIKNKEQVKVVSCHNDEELQAQLRAHDILVMPCKEKVTTDIYAKALSQGLPLLYAQGGCFDGIYPEGHAGYAVNPNHIDQLVEKILYISDRYATIMQHLGDLQPLNAFNIDENYRKYLRIYGHQTL